MKKLVIALVVLVVAGLAVFMVNRTFSKVRKVETSKLTASFASASTEIKAEIKKAVDAIKLKDFTTGLTSLKKVAESGNLNAAQKQALENTVTDITVIIEEKPPANSEELYDKVAEITEALNS